MDKMHEYFNSLHNILTRTEVTDANSERVDTTTAIDKIIAMLEAVRDARAKNIFIGNVLEVEDEQWLLLWNMTGRMFI